MLYHLFYALRHEMSGLNVVRYITFRTAVASLTALFLVLIMGPWMIERLRRLQVGQFIREEGPQAHRSKAGTPTMGGLLILTGIVVPTLLWGDLTNRNVWICVLSTIAFGAIGFADDYLKVVKKRNLGLKGRYKMTGQVAVGLLVGVAVWWGTLYDPAHNATRLVIPFLKTVLPDLGLFYIPFAMLVLVAASNAVNMTDGLDGLAIGCTLIAAAAFTVLAYVTGHRVFSDYLDVLFLPRAGEVTVFCGAMVGASMGFLWWNCYPAQIFMGDVGSLSLGGALGTVAILIKQELLLITIGGVFVLEALSVILQVASFKLRRKRIFRMAPLHHHFELIGWAEPQIIIRFLIIAFVFALFSVTTLNCDDKTNHRRGAEGNGENAENGKEIPFRVVLCDLSVHLCASALKGTSVRRVGDEIALELAGKNVVVVGLARSGVAAAEFLAGRGAHVVATDGKPEGDLPEEALNLRGKGVRLEVGGHRAATFRAADLVVASPGVPWNAPELEAARAAGVPVIGELELGYRYLKGRVAAITGTKGKSTTTAALGAMLREAGGDVRVGGNIGTAVTGLVEGSTDATTFVLEVSSFQLEASDTFHPQVAVFLNLSADHLDRHASYDEYAQAKARIFAHQVPDDWAVVNADDPGVLALAAPARSRRLPFAPVAGNGDGAFFAEGEARLRRDGREETLFRRDEVRLPGAHLEVDLLAAAAAARLLGAPAEAIARAVRAFRGVEHVLEHVADIAGVAFFNDSKATNVDAARKSLESFDTPLVVIIGGRYKGGDFADLRPALARRGRAVVAIGETRDLVTRALSGTVPVVPCDTLRGAVETALATARPGDTVLLAPACSSFDMFRDYAERGRAYKDEVRRLAGAPGAEERRG